MLIPLSMVWTTVLVFFLLASAAPNPWTTGAWLFPAGLNRSPWTTVLGFFQPASIRAGRVPLIG
jgi:hypothetical protein